MKYWRANLFSFVEAVQPLTVVTAIYYLFIGMGSGDIALLKTFFFVALLLGDIPSGILADKLGVKTLVIIGKICEVAGILIMITASHHFILLALAECLLGVGFASISGLRAIIVGNLSENGKHASLMSTVEGFTLAAMGLSILTAPMILRSAGIEVIAGIQLSSIVFSCLLIWPIDSGQIERISMGEHIRKVRMGLRRNNQVVVAIASMISIIALFRLIPELFSILTVSILSIGDSSSLLCAMLLAASAAAFWVKFIPVINSPALTTLTATILCFIPTVLTILIPGASIVGLLILCLLIAGFRGISFTKISASIISLTAKDKMTGAFFAVANVCGTLLSAIVSYCFYAIDKQQIGDGFATASIFIVLLPFFFLVLRFITKRRYSV